MTETTTERALRIAREAVAARKEEDDAPNAARLIREGNWDDCNEVRDAYLGAFAALAATEPKAGGDMRDALEDILGEVEEAPYACAQCVSECGPVKAVNRIHEIVTSALATPPQQPSAEPGAGEHRELIALLRREARYSSVWFADKLTEAADLISDLLAFAAIRQQPGEAVEADRQLLEAIREFGAGGKPVEVVLRADGSWEVRDRAVMDAVAALGAPNTLPTPANRSAPSVPQDEG